MRFAKYILLIFWIVPNFAISQEFSDSLSRDSSMVIMSSDSLITETDTSEAIQSFKMKKNTWLALAFSAIPGGGQIYVESYWKAPIFFAAAVALGYFIYDNDAKFADYQNQANYLTCCLKADPASYEVRLAKSRKELYRDRRDQSAFYLLGVYALAMIDAYTGAHLYDFDVSDEITLSVIPNKHGALSLNFSYSR